jgi:peptide/nickel transport system ATP-binding protein
VSPPAEPLLRVEDLRVSYATEDGVVRAVDGISYSLQRGRTLGIVGESGSGKTVAALSVLGLTRAEGATVAGSIWFEGHGDLLALAEPELRAVRGGEIAMVFQDPLSTLHPMYRVGAQIVEAIRAHGDIAKAAARTRTIELLDLVGIPDPSKRVDAYPHELSGGQRQRAMIAMALSGDPKLLIADEPTTALDVTVQAQILALLSRLQRERGMALVLVTHDLGVVAEMADEIAVMYAGRIVEHAPAERVLSAPEHPYTWGLLRSIPTLDGPREELLTPIPGAPPSPLAPPPGCRFHPRCPYSEPEHARTDPGLEPVPGQPDHKVACLLEPEQRRRLWSALRDGRGDEAAGRVLAVGGAAPAADRERTEA